MPAVKSNVFFTDIPLIAMLCRIPNLRGISKLDASAAVYGESNGAGSGCIWLLTIVTVRTTDNFYLLIPGVKRQGARLCEERRIHGHRYGKRISGASGYVIADRRRDVQKEKKEYRANADGGNGEQGGFNWKR